MILGNLFLQPDSAARINSAYGMRETDTFAELLSRIIQDAAKDGAVWQKIIRVFREQLQALGNASGSRIGRAGERIRAWLNPVLTLATAVGRGSGNSPLDVVRLILQLVGRGAESLTVETITAKLTALVDIIENDLGLTRDGIARFLTGFLDNAVNALTAEYLSGTRTETAMTCFLTGSLLDSLKTTIAGYAASIPSLFDMGKIITELSAWLTAQKWDETLAKLADPLSRIEENLENFSPLFSLFGAGDAARSGGDAARDPLSWYAAWFFNEGYGVPAIDAARVADRFRLDRETIFSQMSFSGLNPGFMEHWAHFSSAIADIFEAVLHGISFRRGDIADNILHMVLKAAKGIVTLSAYDHGSEDWLTAFTLLYNKWLEYSITFLLTMLTSLEGAHFGEGEHQRIIYYLLSLLGANTGEMVVFANLPHVVREFSLSLFTLINNEPGANSGNNRKIEGLCLVFGQLATLIGAACTGKSYYGFPVGVSDDKQWPFWVSLCVGGVAGNWVGFAIGYLLSAAVAREWPEWSTSLSHFCWTSTLGSIIHWFMFWYILYENNTDGGKMGKDFSGNPVTFPLGYPDYRTSPYKLPFNRGDTLQCVQGNQSIFNHNYLTYKEMYAVDFAHDHGMEVLACREGRVDSYSDEVRDHSDTDWNYIRIKHTTLAPEHDRDQDGITETAAVYGHGRHFGVIHAFAVRGIPANKIGRRKIKQGTLIMYSGDTGRSAYNHLHMEIKTNNAPSIPFVYRDVDGGVTKTLWFYKSGNEKTGAIKPVSLYHPDYHKGIAGDQGTTDNFDSIILDGNASGADNEYKDCHILVTGFTGIGFEWRQYKKIIRYEGGTRKAFIDGNWVQGRYPARGDDFRIGAPPYAAAYRFHKNFAYLAANNAESGLAENFADNRQPYTYAAVGAYHPPVHTGAVRGVSGADHREIELGTGASAEDSLYIGGHIVIKRLSGSDWKIIGYRQIENYNGSTRKVTVAGTWGITPAAGDRYAIGPRPYQIHNGTVQSTPPATGNTVTLEDSASSTPGFYRGSWISIKRAGRVILEKAIIAYNNTAKAVTVEGTWGAALQAGDEYFISDSPRYRRYAYRIANNADAGHTPAERFADGRSPYVLLTFNREW